jgi:hypothetical protein
MIPYNLDGTRAMTEPTDEAIKDALTAISRRLDHELYALSESDLAAQWYFKWDERGGLAWNIYEFSDMLEMHKRRCRRWEEHHNGSMCVVERVRDKYLMPRIKEFVIELTQRRGETS